MKLLPGPKELLLCEKYIVLFKLLLFESQIQSMSVQDSERIGLVRSDILDQHLRKNHNHFVCLCLNQRFLRILQLQSHLLLLKLQLFPLFLLNLILSLRLFLIFDCLFIHLNVLLYLLGNLLLTLHFLEDLLLCMSSLSHLSINKILFYCLLIACLTNPSDWRSHNLF